MAAAKKNSERRLPEFDLSRCKRCGICSHICPAEAIGARDDGTPFLASPEACTSCGLCEDMCPDWAICLTSPADEEDEHAA